MSPIEKKAAKTAKSLRRFHKMGIEANELARNAKYGDKNKIKAITAKFGRTKANVTQARAFAKLVKTSELEKICQLRNSKGAAFGPGLVSRLFPLKKREDRRTFLSLWKENSLSARKLEAAIRTKFPKVNRGGRKPIPPTSEMEAMSQLHCRCTNWVNWYQQLNEQLAEKQQNKLSAWKLTADVKKQREATIDAVKQLQSLTKDAGRVRSPKKSCYRARKNKDRSTGS